MTIDFTTIHAWADATKTAAETLVAIITAVKAITAIIRAHKPRRQSRHGRRRTHRR